MKGEQLPFDYQDDVRIFASISELMGSSTPFEEVIGAALRAVSEIVSADGSSILLINRKAGDLSFYVALGEKAERLRTITLARGEGIAGFVAETGAPVVIADVRRDPRFSQRADQATGFKTRSIACVPLRLRDVLTGVIEVVSRRVGAFRPRDLEALTVIGGPIAILIENARLMNEIGGMRARLDEAVAERERIAAHNSRLFEQARQQAEELEQAIRVKSEFLGIMSHELKTPLYVILGYAEVLRDKLLTDTDKGLAKIIQYSHDLMTLIDSILTASKLEAGGIAAAKEEVDLTALLGEIKALYEIPMSREVALAWNLPAWLPRIVTDGEKLKHILQNLINNALKYTEKGTVTVTARVGIRNQELGVGAAPESRTPDSQFPTPDSRFVEFTVADTGIGIPRDQLSAIFDMFGQVEDSRKRARGGVGLGLYIVKNFTQALGGSIQVESEIGRGSMFTVSVPIRKT